MAEEKEKALIGWREIASVFRCSERKMMRHRDELRQTGVIWQTRDSRTKGLRWACFPSDIKAWARTKGLKGEIV